MQIVTPAYIYEIIYKPFKKFFSHLIIFFISVLPLASQENYLSKFEINPPNQVATYWLNGQKFRSFDDVLISSYKLNVEFAGATLLEKAKHYLTQENKILGIEGFDETDLQFESESLHLLFRQGYLTAPAILLIMMMLATQS